jgi:hypothetical protein
MAANAAKGVKPALMAGGFTTNSPFQLAVPRKMRACWPLAPQGVNTAPEKRVAFSNTVIIAAGQPQGRWAAVVTSGADPCSIRE